VSLGIRSTIRSGIRSGIRAGVSGGLGPSSPFTLDATSLKGVPQTVSEYTAAGFAAPTSIWLMQETSGNLADSVGSRHFAQLNSGAAYNQTIAGWTRKGLNVNDGSSDGFLATGPNMAADSFLMLLYVAIRSAPASERTIAYYAQVKLNVSTAPSYLIYDQSLFMTGAGAYGTTVHPVIFKLDRGESSVKLYTDLELLAPTPFGASETGTGIFIGGAVQSSAAASYLYGALWTGASANMSDSTVHSLLAALQWVPTLSW
jgi:hypothetical protein